MRTMRTGMIMAQPAAAQASAQAGAPAAALRRSRRGTMLLPLLLPLAVALVVAAMVLAARAQAQSPGQEDAAGQGDAAGQAVRAVEPTSALTLRFTNNIGRTAPAPSPTELEAVLLGLINGATSTIDAAIYDFNRAAVRDALLAAKARGVVVRVVTDDEAHEEPGFKPFYDALAAAGIPIVDDGVAAAAAAVRAPLAPADLAALLAEDALALGPSGEYEPLASGIMHDKYFIVDKQRVWTGSVNMSNTDIGLNHNNGLLIVNPAVAAAYQADFDQMIAGMFGTVKSPSAQTAFSLSLPVTSTVAGAAPAQNVTVPLELYFSPQDNPIAPILDEVNAATTSIDFAIFYFTSDPLRDALIAAHQRGVRIRGIWDKLGSSDRNADDEALCAAGISVRVEETAGKMHNKLMVIDAGGSDPRVVTGSLNWTASATTINNENTLILHHALIAAPYAAQFQSLWEQVGGTPCNPEPVAGPTTTRILLPLVKNGPPDPNAPQPTPTPVPQPTPTVAPTPLPTPQPNQAAVRIERIVYNPAGEDLQNERVELRNDAGVPVNLAGWTLRDAAETVYTFPDVTLEAAGALTVWVKAGTNGAANLYWGRTGPVWNNDGDTATLRRPNASVASTCTYNGGGEEHFCTAATP